MWDYQKDRLKEADKLAILFDLKEQYLTAKSNYENDTDDPEGHNETRVVHAANDFIGCFRELVREYQREDERYDYMDE